MRVLVAEDETILAHHVADGLRDAGMAVDLAHDGPGALEKLDLNAYDVVVLDRDLPGMSGDEVCRELSGRRAAPLVLMLTAAADPGDRIDGLAMGADDYLGKPFAFAELVLRVRALARRGRAHPALLTHGDGEDQLVLDSLRRRVRRGGRPVPLTAKEFGVLEALLAADGAVVSAEDLLERVWDEHADPFTNTVRVTVNRLRRKLGDPPMIETLVGAGYRIP
ncbi:MAG: response regulator transcription factor [Mycobacteriales bacterium]